MLTITPEFIAALKNEGDKASALCVALNADQSFHNVVNSTVHENFKNNGYTAEHILLHDLMKIWERVAALVDGNEKIPIRAKFILIYLYERLQGKDLTKLYNLDQLMKLPQSSLFDKNVAIIQMTTFFHPPDNMEREFMVPAMLCKINHDQFFQVTTWMKRIAAFIVKADNTVTPQAEALLKEMSEKINHPKIPVGYAIYNEVPDNDSLEIVMKELRELIGLDEIKQNVEDLTSFLKVRKLRVEKGLKSSQNSLHAVFMGPPGTGKTTVARLLGRILKHLGYVKKGHLVETDRAGMVAGYVGQTAIKVDEIVKTAIGGVLFVDEAYSLTAGGYNDYGREAVEILLKRMEDHRDNLVVIVAGYSEEIQAFIQSNPGLQSRFSRYFKFDHFSPGALLAIFKSIASRADFVLTKDAEDKLTEIIERIHEKRHRSFGNARTMRNLFEKMIERQANRIIKVTPVTQELLMTLTEEDVPDILKTVKEIIQVEEEEDKIKND